MAIEDTCPLCPFRVCRHWPVSADQTLIEPSLDPDATKRESSENDTLRAVRVLPSSVRNNGLQTISTLGRNENQSSM